MTPTRKLIGFLAGLALVFGLGFGAGMFFDLSTETDPSHEGPHQ